MEKTILIEVILSVLITIGSAQIKFNRSQSPGQIAASGRTETDNRLGLLASTLGVEPVPGSTPGWTCECLPNNMPPFDGSGVINIRVVNQPPAGVTCPPGYVYTCIRTPTPTPPDVPMLPPPSNRDTCGLRTIVPFPVYQAGQAEFGEYPWVAVILDHTDNYYLGSGAILDAFHVLTAAHKVSGFRSGCGWKVRVGEWNTLDNSEPFKHVEVDIDNVVIHPGFSSQNLQNDVAVITLKAPLHLGAYPHIRSVCLPNQQSDFVGQRCWVAGFGKDAFNGGKNPIYMKEVDVPVVGWNECESRLRGTKLGNFFILNRNSFLCAGGEPGKDACTEDGGAPLVCEDTKNGRFQVVGIVAWGIGCAENSIPGVYVNVPNFVNWISANLK